MNRDDVYLRHILDAILSIEEYVTAGRDAFLSDSMRQDAVMRRLEIIGEAAKQLSTETTAKKPEIPWREVADCAIDSSMATRASISSQSGK